MADDAGLDRWVRRRPQTRRHAERLSALDAHGLAVATDPASPDVAHRVPEGRVELQDVTHEYARR